MGFAFLCMVAGPLLGFNAGGIATKIGIADNDAQAAIGVFAFVMGALDLLVTYWLFIRKKKP